jgi:hypothetical protein
MLIIWSGRGWVVPAINLVAWVLFAFALQPFYHKETSQVANVAIVGLIAFVVGAASAGAIYVIAKRIESKPPRVLIDKATGREIKLRKSAGTFFFIPTRVWPFISAALWVLLAVGGIMGGELMASTAAASLTR